MDPIHHSQDDQEHQGGQQTDMQRELANQVAAQAIEAAVAAQSEAGAEADAGVGMAQELAGGREDEASDIHMRDTSHPPQHHPRQPTFPRSRHSFATLSNSESPVAGPSAIGRHPVRGDHAATSAAQGSHSVLSANDQIAILRESYARNPNPGKQELERLAARTERPWNKIREYFRQRRNKLRGLEALETMIEPGRAQGWLLITYRSASPTSYVPQLNLYSAYKHRFDPYSITTPLLGGQDLIQLACATFPGCEMARDEGEYVLKGLAKKVKEGDHRDDGSHDPDGVDKTGHKYAEGVDPEDWEKGMEGLVEPLRAGSWLLSSFQSHASGTGSPITQTDLYTSYAARFSSLLSSAPNLQPGEERCKDEARSINQAESLMAFQEAGLGDTRGEDGESVPVEDDDIPSLDEDQHLDAPPMDTTHFTASASSPDSALPGIPKENRLLTPLELINLTRMTFPTCEPLVDENGRFIVKGLERREGYEPGKKRREGEMYPFALMRETEGETRVGEEFVRAIKRKLASLQDGPDLALGAKIEEGRAKKRREEPLTEEDREMLEGLKRFKSSRLGQEVHDACISQ
ncbi:hypothetical protein L198_04167 [Cryptococcus wingfieldii CBS 7118]|uniref:Homeobox domain-containing protein n=1 Tax=Cryptococcus wingfieldii CBS 7118 TaxID=1295528 RepID=A0A1E3J6G1_9TREE|nr:hypothetical protein L198_04167 [Cryptococcus wingfieldii CBS 7118]ODN96453.1 hypothetical protein L198_04167 [Cryptococcus wingfieldii CBS 7118]